MLHMELPMTFVSAVAGLHPMADIPPTAGQWGAVRGL